MERFPQWVNSYKVVSVEMRIQTDGPQESASLMVHIPCPYRDQVSKRGRRVSLLGVGQSRAVTAAASINWQELPDRVTAAIGQLRRIFHCASLPGTSRPDFYSDIDTFSLVVLTARLRRRRIIPNTKSHSGTLEPNNPIQVSQVRVLVQSPKPEVEVSEGFAEVRQA